VEAENTPGGQWRIAATELERLKSGGVPTLPRPLPTETGRQGNGRARYGHPELLAEASDETVAAGDEVARLDKEIKALDLKLQWEQKSDSLMDHQRMRAELEAQRRAAEKRRRDEADAQQRRVDRENRWLQYAMNGIIAAGARGEVEAEMHEEVLAALDCVRPTEPDSVVRQVVDAAFHRVMKPWHHAKEKKRAIEDARDNLPSQMRGFSWAPTRWDTRARGVAADALNNMRPDADFYEMCTVAREAVKTVVDAF